MTRSAPGRDLDLSQASRSQIEAELREQRHLTRHLALSLAAAEQRERASISKVLHDHLQPLIHGAKMWAEAVQAGEPDTAEEAIDRIVSLLDRALTTTRSMVGQLTPPILQTAGFAEAIEWLADHLRETHALEVKVHFGEGFAVDDEDTRTLLFEAARELLFNVAKHADVRRAWLRAATENGQLYLAVEDAGCGMAGGEDGGSVDSGSGLRTLSERIQWAGGALEIESSLGQGTCIQVRLPAGPSSGQKCRDGAA